MILDITGIYLIPGNGGRDCPGNGTVPGVECACEECAYGMCCQEDRPPSDCLVCTDQDCPGRTR